MRLAILDILVRRGGEVCVCDLEGALPVKQPTVSHHLRLLREAGWIDTVRKGVGADQVARGDAVLVKQGKRIAADGVMIDGTASVDKALITSDVRYARTAGTGGPRGRGSG